MLLRRKPGTGAYGGSLRSGKGSLSEGLFTPVAVIVLCCGALQGMLSSGVRGWMGRKELAGAHLVPEPQLWQRLMR